MSPTLVFSIGCFRGKACSVLAFFTTWRPAGIGIDALVRVEGHRWAIEDSFGTTKKELGLGHHETRSWHGWHRRISLVMLCVCHDGGDPPPRKRGDASEKNAHDTPALIRLSIQEVRRIAVRLAQRRIAPAHIIA